MNSFTLELHIKNLVQTEDSIVFGSFMNSKGVSADLSPKYGRNVETRLLLSFYDISGLLLERPTRANILTSRL